MTPDTEPSAEALKAAADALPITWGRQLVRDIALALDRFRAAGVREWQPIETAPKLSLGQAVERGCYILLWNGHHTGCGFIRDDKEEGPIAWDEAGEFIAPQPTHWQPLPEPPHGR